jgi:hypothetical protein
MGSFKNRGSLKYSGRNKASKRRNKAPKDQGLRKSFET